MFGIVMRQTRYCKPFLEEMLGVKIQELKYQDETTDLTRESIMAEAVDENSVVYDIELRIAGAESISKFGRFCQSVMDMSHIRNGGNYNELHKSCVIFISESDPFQKGFGVYTFESICREDSSLSLNDDLSKIVLNLSAWEKVKNPKLSAIMRYFYTGSTSDKFTTRMSNEVQKVLNSDRWMMCYRSLQRKYQAVYRDALVKGRTDGFQSGLTEGMEKGRKTGYEYLIGELLKKEVVTAEALSDATGMTIEEIEQCIM